MVVKRKHALFAADAKVGNLHWQVQGMRRLTPPPSQGPSATSAAASSQAPSAELIADSPPSSCRGTTVGGHSDTALDVEQESNLPEECSLQEELDIPSAQAERSLPEELDIPCAQTEKLEEVLQSQALKSSQEVE
eukprot:5696931-Lingulodinium_polyedra.AAC.1